jgi:hypothetical protein
MLSRRRLDVIRESKTGGIVARRAVDAVRRRWRPEVVTRDSVAADAIDSALAGLIERAGAAGGTPPVERWNPPSCGDLDIRVGRDGRWHYLGTPIGREALVRLFASVMWRDGDGRYYLVTPAEKVGITVEDAPFLAVEMHAAGTAGERRLTFRTNVGDVVTAGPAHPMRFDSEPETGGLKPYVLVRGRLEARLTRSVAHELAALAERRRHASRDWYGVASGGAFFPMAPADDGATGA